MLNQHLLDENEIWPVPSAEQHRVVGAIAIARVSAAGGWVLPGDEWHSVNTGNLVVTLFHRISIGACSVRVTW